MMRAGQCRKRGCMSCEFYQRINLWSSLLTAEKAHFYDYCYGKDEDGNPICGVTFGIQDVTNPAKKSSGATQQTHRAGPR